MDKDTHQFSNCPTCKGMVLVIHVDEETALDYLQRQQVGLAVEYCDANNIPVTEKERKRAA